MIDLETYATLKKEAEERRHKAWEEYQKVCDLDEDILLSLVDLKGKYIKMKDEDGLKYIFVSHEFEADWNGREEFPAILLRGLGFISSFSGYWDYTYAKWDMALETYIRFDNFEEDCSKITEITKEEFNEALAKMLEGIKKHHMEWCDDTY